MNQEDLVTYKYWTDGKNLYKLQSWCEYPTAEFKNIETGQLLGGALCSLNLSNLTPLREVKS